MLSTFLAIFIAYSILKADRRPMNLAPASFLPASSISIDAWVSSGPVDVFEKLATVIKDYIILIAYLT